MNMVQMMHKVPSIQFYPTLRCNYRCDFCFNKGLPEMGDVKADNFEKIVSVLKKAGVEWIDILGGEPTLHPELMPLLDIIRMHQLKSNLSSNGTNVDALNALSERYDRQFLHIGISLNDHELSEELQAYIIRHKPVLKSVLKKNKTIPLNCEKYMGLPGIDYFLIYMDIADRSDLENSVPFYVYYQELVRLKSLHQGLEGMFCAGFFSDESTPFWDSVRCPAGTTKLSIAANGAVYPCYLFFRYPEFEIGNILKDDFQEICQSPILNYFRTFTKNKCPDTACTLSTACHGGCPAMSYMFFHDLDAPDPRCSIKASINTA